VYLIAWEEKRGVARSYRLERVASAEVLEERFDPPLGFSVGGMLAHSWGIWSSEGAPVEVSLLFSAGVARRVRETVWHPSQRLEALADGRLRMRVLVSSLVELRPWVLGWGASCEGLSPGDFRESVAAELKELAASYAAGAPGELEVRRQGGPAGRGPRAAVAGDPAAALLDAAR